MNNTTIYPLQAWGLGDIIFCQGLAKHWREEGKRVVWGVSPHYVEGLTMAYPDVTFLDDRLLKLDWNIKDKRPFLDGTIAPIRWSDSIMCVPYSQVMRAKYDMYGLDWQMWRDVMYKRTAVKEHDLYNQLTIQKEYNLISPYYGSRSQYRLNIEPDNGLPNIYMSSLPGYSLFDWSLLIEKATTIHAVSSSIVYLLELLNLQASEVHLYGREAIERDTWYKQIEYILTKEYEIH